jgi:hypothetical protein
MIRVYSTPDSCARLISFDATELEPGPPLELVQIFRNEEREWACELLAELGGQGAGSPRRIKETRQGPPAFVR